MDRLAGDLIGLPVLSLDTGSKVAMVADMILDPARRQVLALIVDNGALGRSPRAIPFGRILSSGPDAVIVQNARVPLDIDRDPVLKGLDNGQNVRGITVMTDSGRKIGTIKDMVIDGQTGEIISYEVIAEPRKERYSLTADALVSMGKDVLYVSTVAAGQIVDKPTDVVDLGGGAVPSAHAVGVAVTSAPAADSIPDIPARQADLANPLGGNTLNARLLFGILILVLGILILIYPALLPLIAGISLIVIGLWIALQNASSASRP